MKNKKINLTELGIRLGLVVAKYPDGRKGAEGIAKISPFTLDRWLAGKSPKMPLLPLAQICRGQNVSMNWLLYGDKYAVELATITRFTETETAEAKAFFQNQTSFLSTFRAKEEPGNEE